MNTRPNPAYIRVAVVDDSAFMRRAVTQMLRSDPKVDVIATGRNGKDAVEIAKNQKPDVMTLDIEMPEMDGLTALRHIVRQTRTRVIMLSSLTTEGSVESLRALKLGAADILAKDASMVSANIMDIKGDLLERVTALGHAKPVDHTTPKSASHHDTPPVYRYGQFDAICIGSSTGGPPVVETILSKLPVGFETPIVIAQHMPELFTRSMASRLDDVCPNKVLHVEDRLNVERGHVYIARGGHHLHVKRDHLAHYRVEVSDEPKDHAYRPSVDALFSSAATAMGKRVLGIVLTGIGQDGLKGSKPMVEGGGIVLAQREDTCVVYGMPKAVTEAGIVAARLAPLDIVATLCSMQRSAAA